MALRLGLGAGRRGRVLWFGWQVWLPWGVVRALVLVVVRVGPLETSVLVCLPFLVLRCVFVCVACVVLFFALCLRCGGRHAVGLVAERCELRVARWVEFFGLCLCCVRGEMGDFY